MALNTKRKNEDVYYFINIIRFFVRIPTIQSHSFTNIYILYFLFPNGNMANPDGSPASSPAFSPWRTWLRGAEAPDDDERPGLAE